MFTAETGSERILKIGQHLPRLWAIKYCVVFFMKHGVYHVGLEDKKNTTRQYTKVTER